LPEAKALLGRDRETAMLAEHALVAAEVLGVPRRASEHLRPPRDDVHAMLLAHPAREEPGKQVVALDAVTERVDEPLERRSASGPFIE
jgi:hypothetical protein